MRFITRIHLSDCGWHEAYYPGTTIQLADPKTGKPRHTIFSLENTGGKTTFLALVLSCFCTSERQFLKTLIRSNQKFADYFGPLPAFILVEWDLSGGNPGFFEAGRLVTGQVVVPRGEGQHRELHRRFFTFRSAQGLALDDIPAPGLRGFEEHGRLNGLQDVQRWLYEMRSGHHGNFQEFSRQSDWRRKLAEEKIDTELLAAQVKFNRAEGGIEDFLNFRSESQFLREFLALTVPEAEAEAVREVLAKQVGKLGALPRLKRRQELMTLLKEKFAPFVDAAGAFQAAQDEASRQARHAGGLKAALSEHGERAALRATELGAEADRHEAAAEAAGAAARAARVELCSAAVESVRRKWEAADALAAKRGKELERSRCRRDLLHGAVMMREILDERARSANLQRVIDAENADLEPRRKALGAMGADLGATLGERAAVLRERQRALAEDAANLKAAARELDGKRLAARESAKAEHRKAAEFDTSLRHAQESRARLEATRILEADENSGAASKRHAESAEAALQQACELRRLAEEKDVAVRRNLERQGELKAELALFENQIEPLQEGIRQGEADRQVLAFNSTILQLAGESEVDPDAEAVSLLLTNARRACLDKVRDAERRQEMLEADRESLEASGLASIDRDARAVTERLRDSGIPDAQPYAAYLSMVAGSPECVRRVAELDPARFAGVAVHNRNELEAARRALRSPPLVSRPVTVAIADDTAGAVPEDRFVVPVEEPAAYDREAARNLRLRIEGDLAQIAETIRGEQDRIERLERTLQDLRAWRERYGGGRIDGMRREVECAEEQIREIESVLASLSGQIETDERDARAFREQAGAADTEAQKCSERARRAGEYHAQWESRVEAWTLGRLRSRRAARTAEECATEAERQRDESSRGAGDLEEQASAAAKRAAACESEAKGIAYTASSGRVFENLDALRRDYTHGLETLQSLERAGVERLRGQQEEIQRVLAGKENRFARDFGALDRAEVESEAGQEGVRDAADAAVADLEAAQEVEGAARAEATAAERMHRAERDRRAAEIEPETLRDLRALESERLAGILAQAESNIVVQEGLALREAEAAKRARAMAAMCAGAARDCRQWATAIDGALGSDSAPPDPVGLPPEKEVAELAREAMASLRRAKDAFATAQSRVFETYDRVRRFADSDALRQLEGEAEVAMHLRKNNPVDVALSATVTAGLIDERLTSIEHDLARHDDDLRACVEELERLFVTARNIVRRMTRDGRIPDDVPRFGGQQVFRIGVDLSRVKAEQRTEILRRYVTRLADDSRIPETGQHIAAELVESMAKALGHGTLGIRLLKPKGEGDTEHMPIDRVTVSGGELLTAAMMIYLVLARLRADAMHGNAGEAGILMLDNPMGKANKTLLLKTQIGLADAMGIQLFYTTGIQDTNALAEFENIVRLRRSRQSQATRRIHVEVEAMRVHIDRPARGGAPDEADRASVETEHGIV